MLHVEAEEERREQPKHRCHDGGDRQVSFALLHVGQQPVRQKRQQHHECERQRKLEEIPQSDRCRTCADRLADGRGNVLSAENHDGRHERDHAAGSEQSEADGLPFPPGSSFLDVIRGIERIHEGAEDVRAGPGGE